MVPRRETLISIHQYIIELVTTSGIQKALKKASGPDKLQNFLFKKFTDADDTLAECLT